MVSLQNQIQILETENSQLKSEIIKLKNSANFENSESYQSAKNQGNLTERLKSNDFLKISEKSNKNTNTIQNIKQNSANTYSTIKSTKKYNKNTKISKLFYSEFSKTKLGHKKQNTTIFNDVKPFSLGISESKSRKNKNNLNLKNRCIFGVFLENR